MTFKVFILSGSVATGKTTVGTHLAAMSEDYPTYDIEFIPEEVDSWAFWLKLFSEDLPKWNYLFQMKVIASWQNVTERLMRLQESSSKRKIVVVERSPRDSLEVFMKTNREYFSESQWQSLETYVTELMKLPVWETAKYIYLRAHPTENHQRWARRARPGEQVSLDYLTLLHDNYEQFAKSVDAYICDNEENQAYATASRVFAHIIVQVSAAANSTK